MNEADLDWLKWNAEGGAGGFTDRAWATLAELDRRGVAIERVRELHRQSSDGTCTECRGLAGSWLQWPCPTLQVLDGYQT